jgi:hypothetical protein
MAGYVVNMNILVSNINHRGQKDLSLKVRHKAYARPLAASVENLSADSYVQDRKEIEIWYLAL